MVNPVFSSGLQALQGFGGDAGDFGVFILRGDFQGGLDFFFGQSCLSECLGDLFPHDGFAIIEQWQQLVDQ